ncbi:MAG TPA: type VI secretion system baseplate subunit TssF [Thiotrichales bacterium]|nr:type VI secretion system baseplate subunit TssF [Thiotrichales bacterium]
MDAIETDGVKCRFRTSFPLDVWPIRVSRVGHAETSTGKKYIDLELKFDGIEISGWNTDSLILYLGGDYHGATDLNYLLHNYLDTIALQAGSSEEIPASAIKLNAVGFDDDEALLQYPRNAFPAYRLIQEYFLMKEKFLFIELSGLRQYTRSISGNSLTIRFYMQEMPVRLPKLANNRFTLHATPAINLFDMPAESIRNDQTRAEYLVRPLRNTRNQFDVYSVNRVTARNRKTAETIDYIESGISHPSMNTTPVYNTLTRQAGDDDRQDTYIAFNYPPQHDIGNQETIMLELTCSNGNYPASLKPGDICKPAPGFPELISFTNLLQPTEIQYITEDSSMLWRLVSHLSLNYLSMANTENLRSMLGLYIFSASSGNKLEVANRKRIEGIENIRVESGNRLIRGMPMRGQTIEVDVNSSNFASRGDMYLFGRLLDYLFASFSSINSFTEFTLKDSVTGERFEWPARVGDKPLL